MNSRKIRTYPPIIVSLAVGIGFTVAAISSINGTSQITAEEGRHGIQESQYAIQTTVTPTPTELDYIQLEETEPVYSSVIKSRDWGADDSGILLKIAMAEAEGESTEGKALVMLTVLNRVWSDGFPNTIEEVVFQPKQFSPVIKGGRYYTTEPNKDCYKALELVTSGWDESYGALYFESCESDSWHSKNLDFLFQHGKHKFYR